MALIIEDGTGVDDADSFVTIAQARTYAASYGYTLPAADTDLEVALRQGAQYLGLFDGSLSGSKTDALQSLVYPRVDSYIISSGVKTSIADDYMPTQIKHAQIIAAATYGAGNDVRANDDGNSIASEAVAGAVSVSYFDNGKTGASIEITAAIDAMKPLFDSYNMFSIKHKRV